MQSIEIQLVNKNQIQFLIEISKKTFIETYLEHNSPEVLEDYLQTSFNYDKIKDELDNPNSEFYFAVLNNQILAYLKMNFLEAQTENKLISAAEIERLYVLKEFQGLKIGNILIEKALNVTRSKSLKNIWLGVWEENLKAIAFYKKQGFKAFDRHFFVLGSEKQKDLLMKLELNYP